jgi:YD repeat-containing protein
MLGTGLRFAQAAWICVERAVLAKFARVGWCLVTEGFVFKRFLVFILVCGAFSFIANSAAHAQSCGPGYGYNIWYWPDPIPDGWQCIYPGQGPWSMLCLTPTGGCPPVHWCPTCGKWVASGGQPINLTNGNTYIQEKDVRIPGLGGGLSLERTWNSMWPASYINLRQGIFGLGWRSTYEERVFVGSGSAANYMVYAKSDGSLWFFGPANGSTYKLAAPASITATLVKNGTTSWTLTLQNGEKRVFNYTSGSLISVADPNGNTTQLAYDGTNRLTTVTDPAARHLTFNYGTGSQANLVTSVTSDVGLSLSYVYDGQSRLSQVTYPDGTTTVSFSYDANSLITTVTDSNGKTLESHTYDSLGRGVTSSKANGVEAITVSYPTP